MKPKSSILIWFRDDLRLADNPALHSAVKSGDGIIPVYIWSPAEAGAWPPGAASRWWLHHSLLALDADLRGVGSRLILSTGDSLEALMKLARLTNAKAVYWNRRYEPSGRQRDERPDRYRTQRANGLPRRYPRPLPLAQELEPA